jgi:large subunit ribosomal protein L2
LKSLNLFQKKLTSLTKSVSGGRNILGRITAFHRGGRGRRKYRFVDFWRKVKSIGVVLKVVHDPNRTAKLGLIFYYNGLLSYILLTETLKVGSLINSNMDNVSIFDTNRTLLNPGSVFSLKNLPLGTLVHSVELYPNMGAQLVRSAGTTALLYRKSNDFAYIKLKSG